MRDIKIKVNDEGFVSAYELFIGNQYENNFTRLVFDVPYIYHAEKYFQYVLFTLSNGTTIARQMVDFKCVVDQDITNVSGVVLLQVIIKEIEGVESLDDGLIMASQPISAYIKPAKFNKDDISDKNIDTNIKLYLDEFDALLAEIRKANKRFTEIIDSNPSSLEEVKDARGNYDILKDRLDTENIQLVTKINDLTVTLNKKIEGAISGSPLVASSVSKMTDTSRVYVNNSDGNWYYHDGSNWQIGGEYLSTETAQDYNYQTVLENYGNINDGQYINYNNGNLAELETLNASDYIEITGLAKIKIENIMSRNTADARGLAYYDKNKNFISGVQYPSQSTSITNIAPLNARYFRFTYYKTLTPIITILHKTEKILNEVFNPYMFNNYEYDITDYLIKNNRGYIRNDNGAVAIYSNLNIYYTNYFPVKKNIKIQIKNAGNYTDKRGLAFYDENLTYISGEQYPSNDFEVYVPENAKYVAFTINHNYLDTTKIILKGKLEDVTSVVNNKNDVPVINPTKYKGDSAKTFNKLLAIGDSLTAGVFNHNDSGTTEYTTIQEYSYPAQIQKTTGIIVDNLGQGGLTTKQWFEQKARDITSGHDFCIINLGANDTKANNVTTSEVDTYLRNIISSVKSLNPKIKIFIATLLPNYYFRNETWYQTFRYTIKNIADTIDDCYYLDMTLFSSCIDDSVYSNGHLTALGYKKESEELLNYISYIIDNNEDDFKYIQFIGSVHDYIR